MKFKHCFTLTVILIILFSLTTVTASENMAGDTFALDNVANADVNSQHPFENVITEEDPNETPSSDFEDNIDLSVNIDVENAYHENKYNRAGFEVPWTITVSSAGGTAKNVKVYEILSDNMEYVSSNATKGVFNPTSGIWDVGDLTSSDNATLTIITKLLSDGKFKNAVNATTDSNDVDLSNNYVILLIKSGSFSEKGGFTEHNGPHRPVPQDPHHTTNTNKRKGPNHNFHALNSPGQIVKVENDEYLDSDSNERSSSESSLNSTPKGKTSKSITSDLGDSIVKRITEAVKVICPYDYIRVPILIFTAFIILLLGIVVYDKVKS